MADHDLVYALNNRVYGPGSLGVGTVTNEAKIRFVITNAGMANVVRVRARINNQPNWTTLIDFNGNANEVVDVFTWDQVEVIVLVYNSLSDQISIVASSFDAAVISVSTPNGDVTDINTINFTSSDNSITISGDTVTGTVDFIVAGGGASAKYAQSFNATTDWSGPSLGLYSITVPQVTHAKTNPTVDLFELVASDNEQVFAEIDVDGSDNVTISVLQSPDLRFAGKLIIS